MTHSLTYQERIVAALGAAFVAILFTVGASFPAHAATISSQMGMGSTGADVSNLQAFLAADETVYPEGKITGYFGPLTEAAVVRFQAKNGISRTGYVGPLTLAAINGQNIGGTGGSDDQYAPTISLITETSTNPATITWVTNEDATGRVMYGTSWPFLFSAAPSVTDGGTYGTLHRVTLPALSGNTNYVYVIESVDISGNVTYTTARSLRTQ